MSGGGANILFCTFHKLFPSTIRFLVLHIDFLYTISIYPLCPLYVETNYFSLTMLCSPANNKPYVRNPINRILSQQGSLLRFIIPQDVFMDKEDGNTSSLTLSLMSGSNQELPGNFWLYLESGDQVGHITGNCFFFLLFIKKMGWNGGGKTLWLVARHSICLFVALFSISSSL